jgi:hypothetical protein
VWREGQARCALHRLSHQRLDQLPAKRLKRAPAVASDENERQLAGLAAKADSAVECDIKPRHSHGCGGFAACPNQIRRWAAKAQ